MLRESCSEYVHGPWPIMSAGSHHAPFLSGQDDKVVQERRSVYRDRRATDASDAVKRKLACSDWYCIYVMAVRMTNSLHMVVGLGEPADLFRNPCKSSLGPPSHPFPNPCFFVPPGSRCGTRVPVSRDEVLLQCWERPCCSPANRGRPAMAAASEHIHM